MESRGSDKGDTNALPPRKVPTVILPPVGYPSSMVARLAPVPVVVVLGVARVKTSLNLKLLGPIPGAPSWCNRR